MATGQGSTGDQRTVARRLVDAARDGQIETVRDLLRKHPSEVDSEGVGGMTALMWASYNGHTDVVQLLLEAGASINKKDDRGQSALHYAVLCEKVEVVKTLLQRRAEINSVDGDGNTPLSNAIRFWKTEVIELLINHPEIDLTIKNKKGQNLLHCASQYGKVDVVKTLLQRGAEINSVDGDGDTPLFYAIRGGNTEVIELQINHPDIDLSIKNKKGQNLLHCAVENGNVDVVKTLLQREAEINSVDGDGDKPLFYAIRRGKTEVIELLINHPEIDLSIKNQGQNLLHCAIENGNVDVVKTLLQRGAEINSVDGDGDTPLFYAIRGGNTEVIELLINHPEIDLSIKNKHGQNLLHCAFQYEKVNVVKTLLQRGAGINSVVDSVVDGGMTALMRASFRGHTDVVQLLLEAGASINKRDDRGQSALHWAVKCRNVDVVKTLLQRGAEINSEVDSVDKGGVTPLMVASNKGHTDVVQLLLEAGASINKKDDRGRSALHWAVVCYFHSYFHSGNVDVVKTLLQRGAEINSVVDSVDDDGMTALMVASHNGHTDVVQLLLEAGASINKKDDGGRSALHWAVQGGKVALVKKLLQRGAEINSVVDSVVDGGVTPLMVASYWGHTDVVQLLLRAGASINKKDDRGQSALHYAVLCGEVDVVKKLLERGAEINSVDNSGNTPLHTAIDKGNRVIMELLINNTKTDFQIKNKKGFNVLHYAVLKMDAVDRTEVVQLMLQKGAAINSVDSDGNTVLHNAIYSGCKEVIEVLINHPNIDFSLKNKFGHNVLHFAVMEEKVVNRSEVIQLLLQNGANFVVDSEGVGGMTALMRASNKGHTDVVQLLLGAGASINKKDNRGWSALHYAVLCRKVDVVKTLLQRGAEINSVVDSVDKGGVTPLMVSSSIGHTDVVELLLEAGASINKKDDRGRSALHCAVQGGKVDAVKTLLQRRAEINSEDVNGDTPLFDAIREGSTKVFEPLINDPNIDLSIKNNQGQNLLHCASQRPWWSRKDEPKLKQIVETLLQAGLDVNSVDNDGNTPLHLAILKGTPKVIIEELLIHHQKIDFSIKNKEGRTVLHLALHEEKNFFFLKDRKEVVQKMLETGADLNSVGKDGDTPIHIAVDKGETEVTELLIDQPNIDLSLCNDKGFTVLSLAVLRNDLITTKLLIDKHPSIINTKDGNCLTALHLAAHNGHDQIVSFLIEKGADLKLRNNSQQTPLMMAVKACKLSTVKLLVENGADLNVSDEDGDSCLHLAVRKYSASTQTDSDQALTLEGFDVAIVCFLLRNGADVNMRNKEGMTAFDLIQDTEKRKNFEMVVETCLGKSWND